MWATFNPLRMKPGVKVRACKADNVDAGDFSVPMF
jgi:hypothetical protein